MAIELVRAMTVEEYLDLEEQSEFRHEFIYGERYEMPGGTSDHEDIIVNILRVFLSRLDRSGFTVRGSGMRVLIDEENAILPDVSVVIGASELAYGKRILLNPAVVVEVLSKSSIHARPRHKARLVSRGPKHPALPHHRPVQRRRRAADAGRRCLAFAALHRYGGCHSHRRPRVRPAPG